MINLAQTVTIYLTGYKDIANEASQFFSIITLILLVQYRPEYENEVLCAYVAFK